jgi:hypothetical protein
MRTVYTDGAACESFEVNRPLSADVFERAIPYGGSDRVAQAIARDPALRSLPSDVIARRFGCSRRDAERAIGKMVHDYAGAFVQVAGRSFDEAIADVGHGRRPSLTPEPSREQAAGYIPVSMTRGRVDDRAYRPGRPKSRALSRRAFGAQGFEVPPIPDLSTIVLSDIYPCTRRTWSTNAQPLPEEINVLNWTHPLITGATSPVSMGTIDQIAQGCMAWNQSTTLPSGKTLGGRSPQSQAQWWGELQQLAATLGWLPPPVVVGPNKTNVQLPLINWTGPGSGPSFVQYIAQQWKWHTPAPTGFQSGDQGSVVIYYWDCSDSNHPRMKVCMWDLNLLSTVGSAGGASLLESVGNNAAWQWEVDGASVDGNGNYTPGQVRQGPPGWDAEQGLLVMFAGLVSAFNALATAIGTVASIYCPTCGVAIAIAAKLADAAMAQHLSQGALVAYGDKMLADAASRVNDPSVGAGLRGFAAALIGLSPSAPVGTAPSGGMTYDYLSTLGTAAGNVPRALLYYANDTRGDIASSADLAIASQLPLLDAQYAVAAMTDTLARFASNFSTAFNYIPPQAVAGSIAARMEASYEHTQQSLAGMNEARIAALRALGPQPPLGPNFNLAAASDMTTPLVLGGAALAAAWAAGLLKGIL